MKAVIVGDNLIPSEQFVARCGPLREAGYAIQAFDWLWADRNEMNQRNLSVENNGPEAEPVPDGLVEAVVDADIVLTHFCPISRTVVRAGQRLKAIGVARGGWENIAVDVASQRGIPVIHIVGRNGNAVAELTVGLILSEMRNIGRSHAAMQRGSWFTRQVNPRRTFELAGKTLGLVGFGAVGQLVVRRLTGFEMQFLAFDPMVSRPTMEELGATPAPLEELMRQSDIVSLHARMLPETEGLIGRDELALMKPTAYLINTARAGLVDRSALIEALQQRTIGGAALDVYWQEPLPPDDPLIGLDNVTLCSHLAGTTLEALHNSVDFVVGEVLAYLDQGKADMIINPGVLAG